MTNDGLTDDMDNPYLKDKEHVDEIIQSILDIVEESTTGLDAYQLSRVLEEVGEDLNEQYNVLDSELNGHHEDSTIED